MNSEKNRQEPFWRDLGRSGRFTLLVALMAILLVSTSSRIPIVFGHAVGKTYQAWGTPSEINGGILDQEWENAASDKFTMTISGNQYDGKFYVMNDATNLYIAVKVSDAFDPGDTVWVYFDNDNDGTFGSGDDIIQCSQAGGFVDKFLVVFPNSQLDTDAGGTPNGLGEAGTSGGFNHFEFSHPLDSGDAAHDFSLSSHATVGFTFAYRTTSDMGGVGYWPATSLTPGATSWGDIVVASHPPTMTVWTDTEPSINGVLEVSEWGKQASFSVGWTYTGTVWVMNDASNLYVAVKIRDASLDGGDMLVLSFDNNNDGSFEAGDDVLAVDGHPQFYDAYCSDNVCSPGPPSALDTLTNGEGASSGDGNFNYFEFSHPLHSGDNAHDFSLSAGDKVGFSLQYIEASGYWGDWPSHNARSWAHITIASAPATADFTVAEPNPSSLSLGPGQSATCTVYVQSVGAFSSPVHLTHDAPSGLNLDFEPNSVTPSEGETASSVLTVTDEGAAPGDHYVTITGTSDTTTHSTTLVVHVSAAAPGAVPGFPVEAIVFGVVLGLFVLALNRSRKKP